jgi:hypothetical protein
MSNPKKPAPQKKSGTITRAAKDGAERVRQATTVARKSAARAGRAARDGATVAVGAVADAAKVAVDATAEFAQKTGKYIDGKSRLFLDAEFSKLRPAGVAAVARLRKANPGASPADVVDLLSTEFMAEEKGVSAKSEKFLAASTNFVITLNEIYGNKVRDDTQRQILLYLLLAANSKAARIAAQVGLVVLSFVSKRFGAVATAVAVTTEFVKKYSGRITWVGALTKLAGIENAGRKSATWVVVNSSLKILGPVPKTWPSPKTAPAKKPAATKTVTRKAVPKKKPAA